MNSLHDLTPKLEANRQRISEWMDLKRSEVPIPFYGSVDVRDAEWKIAVVDANHFPAGFNNIAPQDMDEISNLMGSHIKRNYGDCKWVHLYPEAHTRNKGYVENIATIQKLLEMAGYRCTVGSPVFEDRGWLDGISGPVELTPVEAISKDGEEHLLVAGEIPCLTLLNNDLTEGILPGLGNQVFPPKEMGWHRRRKSEHYLQLQAYVDEMADMLEIDSWHLMSEWFVSENKCLEKETCRVRLAEEIDEFLLGLSEKYAALGIEREPVAFIKNDRGTYGLGIMVVTKGEQILELSNRKMNRLMYAKGGVDVENFLIQEGVPTCLKTEEGAPVEPVVYLVDGQAASWFYRINPKKGDNDNLNSPSARFESIHDVGEAYGEHAQGWHALVAELSMLAMGKELLAYQEHSNAVQS
jgi:glutamate--cysteine ligase